MIDFFDKLYTAIGSENKILERIRFYSALRFLTRASANVILPFFFKFTRNDKDYKIGTSSKSEGRYIVSLTSFPVRIPKLWMVIESLLRQTIKPDMILVYLSKEQFEGLASLPQSLLKMQKRGVTISLEDGDLKSHKKYYYALQQYPNDILITVDDDILYRSNAIETLIKFSQAYPHSIISNYSLKILYNADKSIAPYCRWQSNLKLFERGADVFFGSGGGTLFPVNSFCSTVVDQKVFLQVCPKADDVWLNAMCRMNGCDVVKTDYYSHFLPILNRNNVTLASDNIDTGNDIQIAQVQKYCKTEFGKDPFAEHEHC